ncbi:hypothetical protein BSU04_01450 [Caballeronia sordidicola]|uniref:Uncharacterized protein n=1 Tax=Caballeronia sordidicola TaxID=196367 RepID=A0A226XCF8_CABSO|nr:hypothetical protein BSU04_01450 [Caballeronia sordidicola]
MPLTFMLVATLAAATYRERPNPRDGSIHFNRLLFALHNIFFERYPSAEPVGAFPEG